MVGLYRFSWLSNSFSEYITSYGLYISLKMQKTLLIPVEYYYSYKNLKNQIEHYKFENETLKSTLVRLQGSQIHSQKTHEMRLFSQRYTSAYRQLAQVLMINIDDYAQFIILDAGSHKGVQSDMVAVYKNCLIGRVEVVYPLYSKIRLITDASCKVPAYCAASGLKGIHEGVNSIQTTRLSFANHLQTVKDGELVLSSGQGLIFPEGFGLGFIKEHVQKDFIYTITIEPLIDFSELDYCYILQKGMLENKK